MSNILARIDTSLRVRTIIYALAFKPSNKKHLPEKCRSVVFIYGAHLDF